MNLVAILAGNILPLYLLVGIGFVAGKYLAVDIHSIARLVIFIIAPIVMFGAMARLSLKPDYALLPVVVFAIAITTTGIMYFTARRCWRDNSASLIGLASVSGNTGYFGLPLAIALYGADAAGIYLLFGVATAITETTVGYYLGARGTHSVSGSLRRVVRLPPLHALWAGLLLNVLHLTPPPIFYTYWTYATGAYVFLGMMIIGIALAKLPRLEFDWRLVAWMFTAKSLLWPGFALAFIALDAHLLHLFQARTHGLLLIFCAVPLMANLVAYAAQLNLHPERAATTVLLSTLVAIVYLPIVFVLAQTLGLI